MKFSRNNVLSFSVALMLVSSGASFAATSTTDPVGFITLNAPGSASGTLSIRSLGLTRAVEYQGSAETKSTNSIGDSEATWTDDQFNTATDKFFVEITSGTFSGATFDIADTFGTSAPAKTIQTVQALPAGLTAPFTFKVRKHWTLSTVFGTGSSLILNGGDAGSADKVLIFNGTGYTQYYYQTSGFGTGWRDVTDPGTDKANQVLFPDDGLIINRKQASPVNVVLMGAVKMGQTSFPIVSGLNVVGNPCAAAMTLGSSGLLESGFVGGNGSTGDQVLFFNGTGYETYYYQTSGFGTGWRKLTDPGTDAGTTSIPVGTALIIKRAGASGFDWKVPQHPASI